MKIQKSFSSNCGYPLRWDERHNKVLRNNSKKSKLENFVQKAFDESMFDLFVRSIDSSKYGNQKKKKNSKNSSCGELVTASMYCCYNKYNSLFFFFAGSFLLKIYA